jgi:K+-sensing histidine kinase KdpD
MSTRLSQSYLARSVFRPGRLRGSGSRLLLFTLECALGVVAVIMAAALAHWFSSLLSVAVLLYLLIVVLTALFCGFWQALIVSLSAVVAQSWFTARQPQLSLASAPADTITLVVFLLAALTVSRLSARVTAHAKEAELQVEQMHDLYEFTRRTLQMNLYVEPGPQLAELVHEIFDLEAVAVFDADLHDVYQAGYWPVDPQELAQNVYYFETSDDDAETGIGRRVVRLGAVPVGSLVVRGETNPLTNRHYL